MLKHTTSYSTGKKPHYRRNTTNQLPNGRRRQVRKPGAQYLRHSQGFGRQHGGKRMRRHDERRPYAFIAVGCAFLFFLATVIWYMNRSVEIELNGSATKVRINSSIEQLITDKEIKPTPGDLLAVDDSVLEKRGGEKMSVKLNGKRVEEGDLGDAKLQPGDKVEIENGRDRYEEHEIQATTIDPKLIVQGSGAISYVKTWGAPGRTEVWTGEVSGKTMDRGVVEEVVDCVVVRRSVSPDDKDKRYVSLTFDEGPSARTDEILRILEEKGVKATFFLSGDAIKGHPDAVRAIKDAGHTIGSNSATDESLTSLSAEDLRRQLTSGFDAVKDAGGGGTALLRAPYGTFSDRNWADAMDIVSVAISWNVDSGDWMLKGAQDVVDTVLGSVSNGNIVLLSDNDATAAQTVEALPMLIDGLREAGYEVVGLPELIGTDEDLADEIPSFSKVEMPKGAVLPTIAPKEGDKA
ncbi:MAG: polysaccharide deacetylase family protein [Collinsella sp.]|nr:polysaccharide deacetylase family protein [Collinsella sp.]